VGGDDEFSDGRQSPFYTRLNQRLAEHYFDDFVKVSVNQSAGKLRLWWMTGRMTEPILMAFWVSGGLSSGKLHLTLNTAGLAGNGSPRQADSERRFVPE
jgi:hypothetical protein